MADDHNDKHGGDGGHGGDAHGGGGGHKGGGHGPGAHSGEHEESGAPEWLISFADNVALLMGFFVILLAMNMQKPKAGGIGGVEKNPSAENSRMIDLVIGIRQGFNRPIDINSTNPQEQVFVKRMKQREQEGETKTPGPDGDKKNNQAIEPSDYFNLTGIVSFGENSSEISPEGNDTLAAIAEQKRGTRWVMEIRGHVSASESAMADNRGMDLAYTRSLNAARELVNQGMKWEQLRVVACGDNERRIGMARDSAAHQSNQRVEIVVTQEMVSGDQYNESGE